MGALLRAKYIDNKMFRPSRAPFYAISFLRIICVCGRLLLLACRHCFCHRKKNTENTEQNSFSFPCSPCAFLPWRCFSSGCSRQFFYLFSRPMGLNMRHSHFPGAQAPGKTHFVPDRTWHSIHSCRNATKVLQVADFSISVLFSFWINLSFGLSLLSAFLMFPTFPASSSVQREYRRLIPAGFQFQIPGDDRL